MTPDDILGPAFREALVDTGHARLYVRHGGSGPPLLLLHGYPETHAAWHRVAPTLAQTFTVIAPDLRGYGKSSCPPSDATHRAYAKRAMAGDMVRLMDHFGFNRFAVMGHDRGGRVAYRLALDRPDCVRRLVLIDIISTWDHVQLTRQSRHGAPVHWVFLAQPAPLPETLIGANPAEWIESRLRRGTNPRSPAAIDPRSLTAYIVSLSDPDRIHATCEDHRAGASCDLADDEADRLAGRRIACPTLAVWARHGTLAGFADPATLWAPWCERLEASAVDGGHYIPEENPVALLAAVTPFLKAAKV